MYMRNFLNYVIWLPYISNKSLFQLALPVTPHLLNRRPKATNPGRFLDDYYAADTRKLVECKASHHISYNPGMGCYTYAGQEIPEGSDSSITKH